MGLKGVRPAEKTLFVAIGVASAALTLFLFWLRPALLSAIELMASDVVTASRPARPAPPDVVVVAVDEKSVNELGRWPWTRKTTARLIASLKGARVVAVDVVFSEPEGPEADAALSGAISGAGNVVLGYFFRDDSTVEPSREAVEALGGSRLSLLSFAGDDSGEGAVFFPGLDFSGVETNTPLVGKGAAAFGAFNVVPSADGIHRGSQLVFKYGPELYPSLALKAVSVFKSSEPVLFFAAYGMDSISLGDTLIPVDEGGSLALNFYGPHPAFAVYSASDVIKGRVAAETFDGKLVFVGVTEKAVYDVRPAPVDPYLSGVEVHATAAANILEERFVVRDSRVVFFELLAAALLPVVLCVALSRFKSTLQGLGAFLALIAALGAGSYLAYALHDVRASAVYPAVGVALAYLSSEAYRNAVVERRSRYLRKAFSTYVSPQIVTEILRDPERLRLGGEKRVITVLFSDIRGFTALSESLAPEDLVRLLNEYLNPMTAVVLGNGGMLDKYIGDAVMAVFNAPIDTSEHEKRACDAAAGMSEKLDELNAAWEKRGYPGIEIGVGISTGEAVVGNMGAEIRFDYTAIGDTVNLASRIEGMNKVYSTRILVAEETYGPAAGGFIFREVDLVRFKGKSKPARIYELLGRADNEPGPRALAASFADALVHYRQRRFVEARAAFEEILARHPGDGPALLYVRRCDEYIAAPPPQGWDGVFEAKAK